MTQVHSRLETRHGPKSLVLSSIFPANGASVLASETPLEIEGGAPPNANVWINVAGCEGPQGGGGAPPNVNVCATLC